MIGTTNNSDLIDLDIETLIFDQLFGTDEEIKSIVTREKHYLILNFPKDYYCLEYVVPISKLVDVMIRHDVKQKISSAVKEAEKIIDAHGN